MNGRLTRRDLLKRGAAGGALLSVPGLFGASDALAAALGTAGGQTLTISNWPYYIDVNEKTKKRPSIEQFQKKMGIKVKYIEDINDNATFFGKIQGALSRGQSTGRDIIVMTDNSPYPALLVQKGWLEKHRLEDVKHIDEWYRVWRSAMQDPKVREKLRYNMSY